MAPLRSPPWRRLRCRPSRGFTLTELVMVMVLVSLLAVVALPRLLDLTAWRLGAFADTLRTEMFAMQRLALAQRRPVVATITGSGVAFAYASGGTLSAVDCPTGTGACIAEGGTRSVTLNAANGGTALTSTGAALPLTISAGDTTLNWVVENDSGLMRRGP